MTRWYYSTNGKAEGPVSPEFLMEQLKAGKFTLVDLVFKEGEAAWKTFGEIPEFRDAYQAPPAFVPPPPQPSTPPAASRVAQDISLDEISIDEFTPTPILKNQTSPSSAREPAVEPIAPMTATQSAASAAPIVVPESNSVKTFEKPADGWPSDWRLSSSWVVLKKRSDGSGYDQDGPFSAEHIIDMIGQGKIEYSQYCWKPGYTRWFRIGNLPEFDRRKRDRDNDTVNQIIAVPTIQEALPALTREELLANVDRLRKERREVEKAPIGTTGKNLVEMPYDSALQGGVQLKAHESTKNEGKNSSKPVMAHPAVDQVSDITDRADFDRSAIAPVAAPAVEPSWAQVSHQAQAAKRRVSPKVMRFGVAALISVVVVVGLVQFTSMRSRQPASQQAPEPVRPRKATAPKTKTSQNDVADPGVSQGADSIVAPSPPKIASSLEISPKSLETAPVIEFQTDMGAQDKIIVKLKAHTGDILRLSSFAKNYEVTGPVAGRVALDLSKEDLPAGTYFVEASVGTAQASTQIFIGQKNDQFETDLEHHLKSISLRQQTERTALYYGSQRFEKLAKDLVTQSQALKAQPLKWKKTLAIWRKAAHEAAVPVLTLAQAPTNEIAFPEQMAAFQAAIERLAAQAKEIDAAIAQKRDIASASAGNMAADMAADFSKLRQDSAQLTGRPQAAD